MSDTKILPGFHVTLFENRHPLIWTWPVHISMLNTDQSLIDQLKSRHWTERFTVFHTDEPPADRGIFLHPNGLQSIYDLFRNNYRWQNTGVAIVFEQNEFFNDAAPSSAVMEKMISVAKAMDFSGVLIIQRPDDPVGWLNYFFENLSHNQNIIEAIQKTASKGYLYYDSKLEEETRLISILKGIQAGMDEPMLFSPEQSIDFYSRITGKVAMKPVELKTFIGEAIQQLHFDHESDGATIIAEMTTGLYSHYGEERFNSHVKGFMLYLSPPPDEMAPDDQMDAAPEDTPEQKVEEEGIQPRFLHAKICEKNDPEKIKLHHLAPRTEYNAYVKISTPDPTWISSQTTINQDLIFGQSQRDEEELTIQWKTDENEPVQSQVLKLPRKGNSGEIQFTLSTRKKKDVFIAQISIYHGQRLIQIAELKSHIVTNGRITLVSDTELNTLFSAASDADSFEKSKAFVRSFHISENGQGLSLVDAMENEKFYLPANSGMMDLVNRMRIDIENAAKNNNDHPEDLAAENNVFLMRRLAIKGNDLAENYLKRDVPPGPIQIVTQQQEFVPLDFVYTLPPPDTTAKMCDHAAEALRNGSCMNCYDYTKSTSFICPFGFWGLSRVIERYRYEGTALPDSTQFAAFYVGDNAQPIELPVLQNSLHASTIKTEAYEAGLRANIYDSIQSNSKQSHWAHSWIEWEQFVQSGTHPESLFLIIHTEIEPILDAVQMEIENANFLVKNQLNEKKIYNDTSTKPIVVVLGCSTSNLQDQTFDIGSQFLNHGAQYVISNFTKIRGQQAGKIMIKLVEIMKTQTQQGSTLGETMLRLRQHLLADGIMVSLAMIAHGDALQFVKS